MKTKGIKVFFNDFWLFVSLKLPLGFLLKKSYSCSSQNPFYPTDFDELFVFGKKNILNNKKNYIEDFL